MEKVIYHQKWDIGAHTTFSGLISDTLLVSIKYGMYATQFFMGNPYSFNRACITDSDISESKAILGKFPLYVFTHFPYVANLAGSKNSLAWCGNSIQDKKTECILKSLEYELSILSSLGALSSGAVLHPGNFPDRKKGISTVAQSINRINFSPYSKLILENSAGQGTSLCTTFEEIKNIIDLVDEDKQKHLGVCIDTCHIFAYGLYDLSDIKEVEKMFADFDAVIGLEKFSLLHLNDSQTPMGSKKDRHACLGTGYIWGQSFDSLVFLMDLCKKYNIPAILETHGSDMLTLAVLGKK